MNVLHSYQNPKINSLVFKLTEYCTQRCKYCYRDNDKKLPRFVMSDDVIRDAIEKYLNFIKMHMSFRKSVYLIWHGGEPLLAGIDKFKKIIDIEEDFKQKYDISIINATQTNGVFFNDEWAKFFSENNFLVGFSLDGPKQIHDIYRKNKRGRSTFNQTITAIQYAVSRGIKTNIIAVITNESSEYPDIIYNFFKNLGISDIDFIPCFDYDTDLTLKPKNYLDFMIRIINIWAIDNFGPLKIRFLNDIRKRIFAISNRERVTIGCEFAGQCGQNWSVGGSGMIYPCECLTPVPRFQMANINETSFSELITSDKMNEVIRSTNDVDAQCFKCDVFSICRAGCLNRRLSENQLNDKRDFYCEARRAIILKMQNIVLNGGVE